METKKTKKVFFGELTEIVKASGVDNMDEILNFINHEIELLDRKTATRSKTSVENTEISDLIVQELEKLGACTITDLLKKSEVLSNYITKEGKSLSNQKISALLRPLYEGENAIVERVQDKRVTLFRLKA